MSSAAYATIIYSVGAPVVAVAEPTTDLGALQFQVTDAARRLFHPGTQVSAFLAVDGGEVGIASIDYFNGIVTLTEAPAEAIELDFAYVTKAAIGGSREYSYELGGDVLDSTSFALAQANGGFRTRAYGLHDVSVSISRNDDLSQKFVDHKMAREMVYIEVTPGGSGATLKGWFLLETDSHTGDLGALEGEDLTFNLANVDAIQQGGISTIFSFS